MSNPTSFAIAIYLDGVDITTHCPLDKLDLEDLVHDPSSFNFTIEDASAITVSQSMIVEVYTTETSPVKLIFYGYILKYKQRKRDNGVSIEYDVSCEDRKVRLQKSVVPYGNYEGLDTDILTDLLANAYPDLSTEFDFSSLVNSVADDLSLDVNDDNMLDLLKKLADQSGASYRFDKNAGGGEILITFDSGGWGEELSQSEYINGMLGYHFYDGPGIQLLSVVAAVGNPDNCVRWTDLNSGTISNGNTMCLLEINLGGEYGITEISFDYFVSGTSNVGLVGSGGQTQAIAGTGAWHSHTFTLDHDTQFPKIGFEATASLNLALITLNLRFDNIRVTTTSPIPGGTAPIEQLVWDSEPDSTDYDYDVDLSDEFGSDFNLDIGGFDDFNSIIVTGGKIEHPISWTYHSNAIEEHLGLELPVKDIAVFKNTGSFGSPVWDELDLGQWGVDKLNSETDGTKEVLYDTVNHWLYFDALDLPPDLENAVKVEGFILRPIRVKVENTTGDEPIFAGAIYDESITTEEQAAQAGFAELEKRNAVRNLSFKTYEPGLEAGQAISVTDTARGLSETLIIQAIRTHWIGGASAQSEVECGNEESSNAATLIANNDKRSRKKAAPAAIGTTEASLLTDEDENVLQDELGNDLYILV
jgi:hypothetical protein